MVFAIMGTKEGIITSGELSRLLWMGFPVRCCVRTSADSQLLEIPSGEVRTLRMNFQSPTPSRCTYQPAVRALNVDVEQICSLQGDCQSLLEYSQHVCAFNTVTISKDCCWVAGGHQGNLGYLQV